MKPNPIKEKEKFLVKLQEPHLGIFLEQYVYEPGFFRFNWHQDYELLIVIQGKINVYIEGSVFVLEENDMILINPLAGHATTIIDQSSFVLLTHFSPKFFNNTSAKKYPIFNCLSNAQNKDTPIFEFIRYYMSLIYTELNHKTKESTALAQGAFQLFCGFLQRYFSIATMQSTHSQNAVLHSKKKSNSFII